MTVCRVLLVDDDELSREILALLLEGAGYAVTVASSGEEALVMLEAGVMADVVLTDLQMPGISGAELASRIRGLAPEALRVVLAMSGSDPTGGVPAGYDAFLLKPFTMEQLASAVERGRGEPVAGEVTMLAAAAAEGGVAADILDGKKLQQLLTSFRPEQLEELFCFAIADAERQLEVMRQAATERDDALYRRCAHSMKGSFGMLGASELWELASEAEVDGVNDKVNRVTTFVLFEGALSRLRHTLISRGICHC